MIIAAQERLDPTRLRDDAPVLASVLDHQLTRIGVGPMALHILDQFSVGLILLDRSARVLFANAAAQSLSEQAHALHLNSDVTALSSEHSRRLGDLIRAALSGASVRAMSVPLPGNGRPLLVLASPIRIADLDRSDIRYLRSAAAVLLICDPDRPSQIPAAWMMEAYGLTRAEVRVALAVASGMTIAHTARRLKISKNTIKTHLRRVYEKTGTRRQAEFSRLMATISLARGDAPHA
jgi:DNA-binding CsgD family transcriptional regulator